MHILLYYMPQMILMNWVAPRLKCVLVFCGMVEM